MDIRSILLLYVQLGPLRVRNWLLVCPNVRAEGMLSSIIDKYVEAIHPGQKSVTYHRGALLGIIGWYLGLDDVPVKVTIPTSTVSNKVRVGKEIIIPLMTQVAETLMHSGQWRHECGTQSPICGPDEQLP